MAKKEKKKEAKVEVKEKVPVVVRGEYTKRGK
jgi:hypothetical protein